MPTPIPIPKHSPWVTQILVINALFKREITTRFGEYRLGFFWMLFEPLLSVIVIGLVIGTIAGRAVPEIPYAFFLLVGKMMLNVFRGSMSTGVRAIGSNVGLLVYPAVQPLDTFITRFLYELVMSLSAFILFSIVGMWLGVSLSLASLHVVLVCFLMTWLMGCGLGLIFGVASAHIKEVEKLVMVLQSPLLFISAVIFPLSGLPTAYQNLLLYNPLVHTIELSRKALFPYYSIEGETLAYPLMVSIVVLSTGLMLFRSNRNFLSKG